MNNQQQFTPKFVEGKDGDMVPDIRFAFGRQQYNTRGLHPQCQPRIGPKELFDKRKSFFSETLYKKAEKQEVVERAGDEPAVG